MQISQLIKDQFKAFLWADETMLKNIPDSYLDIEVRSSFPSIRKTYNHMWDANNAWFFRLTGDTRNPAISKTFTGTGEEWRKAYLQSVQQFIDFLNDKDDAWFLSDLSYKSLKGDPYCHPVFETLMHAINHATGHRGQTVTMLRNAGFEGPVSSVDFIQWYRSANK